MEPEHSLTVQLQQEVKLGRHGVEFLFSLYVVVVVVPQFMASMRVGAERPESVQMHIGTQLQSQADHDQAAAKPYRSYTFGTPEDGQILEVIWVKENRPGGAFEVLDGVQGPQGHRSVVAIGEGGNEQQGVAVGAQTLHEWTPASHESPVPENTQ